MGRRARILRNLTLSQWRVVAASLVLIPAIRIALALWGFRRSTGVLARWSSPLARRPTPGEPYAVAYAVALVSGRRIIGTLCLVRSITLWFLLRRRGIDAELVIGALPAGGDRLQAHAWVEVGGEPVNDAPDVRARFGTLGVSLPRLRDQEPVGPGDCERLSS